MLGDLLWSPDEARIRNSNMHKFILYVNNKLNLNLGDYKQLYSWSVNESETFWKLLLEYSTINFSGSTEEVKIGETMPGVRWFPNVRLNFAENLLRINSDKLAVIAATETGRTEKLTFNELNIRVKILANWLKNRGIVKGDRVCGYVSNTTESVIAMLATTAIGAIWSSSSSDFGVQGVVDRFNQINPKVLFVTKEYRYNGKEIDCTEKIKQIINNIPSIQTLVLIGEPYPVFQTSDGNKTLDFFNYSEIFSGGIPEGFEFEQVSFNDPVYIMYSSGTTGKPKCIVHGAGGTLLQHYKEHTLHTDLRINDVIFYYTTCGWMMWNWLVSALHTGSTIILFDGNPFYPTPKHLWNLVDELEITVFGTSPRYISGLEKLGYLPKFQNKLSSLRCILSTGSPLSPENFEWIYKNIKSDVQLSSISGGTDIISCFMLGAPVLPVRSGYIQCRGLGMAVKAYNERGEEITAEAGELVCTKPAPSMPVGFWDDIDGQKYYKSYFEKFPGVWTHGDFISITSEGEVIVYGRSDATLNPGGVRIGTSEIYSVVENIPEVTDSLVVGVNRENDIQVVLFVTLVEGVQLSEPLIKSIKNSIKEKASPRHIPHFIFQISDVPRTLNGKKVELTVSRILNGQPIDNKEALINPESLEQFYNIKNHL